MACPHCSPKINHYVEYFRTGKCGRFEGLCEQVGGPAGWQVVTPAASQQLEAEALARYSCTPSRLVGGQTVHTPTPLLAHCLLHMCLFLHTAGIRVGQHL